MSKSKIGILTSGGDAPGMNATLFYLKKYLSNYNIVFYKKGFKGLCFNEIYDEEINNDIIDLSGSIIGSSRYQEFKTNIDSAIKNIKDSKIEVIIVIGGNGSFEGAKLLSENNINVIFIPATIDNDINFSEYCLGYSSTLNEIHNDLIKLRSTFKSHNNICIVEVMGKHCPNISIASSLSFDLMFSLNKSKKMTINDIVKTTSEYYTKNNYGIGIISEFTYSDDEINHIVNRIRNNCVCEVRYCKLGYLQRGANVDYIDIKHANLFAFYTAKLINDKCYNQALFYKSGQISSSNLNETEKLKQISNLEQEIVDYDSD